MCEYDRFGRLRKERQSIHTLLMGYYVLCACTYSFEPSFNDEKNFLQKPNFRYIWNQGASKMRLVTKNFEFSNNRGGTHPLMT